MFHYYRYTNNSESIFTTSCKFEEYLRDRFKLLSRKTCPLSVKSKICKATALLKKETMTGILLGIIQNLQINLY